MGMPCIHLLCNVRVGACKSWGQKPILEVAHTSGVLVVIDGVQWGRREISFPCCGRANAIVGAVPFAQSSFKIDVEWIDSLASLFGI